MKCYTCGKEIKETVIERVFVKAKYDSVVVLQVEVKGYCNDCKLNLVHIYYKAFEV